MSTTLTAEERLLVATVRAFVDRDVKPAVRQVEHAKLFAPEVAVEIALDAVRIHGGYGYSCEYDVERYFRDAPLMIVGEGTNEIQRNVIAAQLVARGGL